MKDSIKPEARPSCCSDDSFELRNSGNGGHREAHTHAPNFATENGKESIQDGILSDQKLLASTAKQLEDDTTMSEPHR